MVLLDGRWKTATPAEKELIRARLATTCARLGIPVPVSADPRRDTPGELAVTLDPGRLVQRPHLRAIDECMRYVLETPRAAVMIWTPPQVGKSWRVSRWAPFWWLIHRPRDRILLASFAESLARGHARAARQLVEHYGHKFGLVLDPAESAASDWSLLSGGGMRARGVGGGLTGQPGDLGLIDDPVKDRQAAESAVIRNWVWDWYSAVFTTRLSPEAREVLTMTRWHRDDLAGRLLARDGRVEDGGRWKVLHLPAIAVVPDPARGFGPDPLDRAPGDPLTHPDIPEDDRDALLAHWHHKRAIVTVRDWDAMYQGSPSRSEGATLSEDVIRERTGPAPASFVRVGVGIDPSGGGRDTAGLVALGVAGDGRTWILADETAVMSSDEWAETACRMAARLDADCFIVETNFGGDMATSLLRRAWVDLLSRRELHDADGKPVRRNKLCPRTVTVNSRKSKVLRAEPVAQAIRMGSLWFAAGADLTTLISDWTLWEPHSTWSPGALDACVHAAVELIPPAGQNTKVVSVAKRTRSQASEGTGIAARRITR